MRPPVVAARFASILVITVVAGLAISACRTEPLPPLEERPDFAGPESGDGSFGRDLSSVRSDGGGADLGVPCADLRAAIGALIAGRTSCASDGECSRITTTCGVDGYCGAYLRADAVPVVQQLVVTFVRQGCNATIDCAPCPPFPPPVACRRGTCGPRQ